MVRPVKNCSHKILPRGAGGARAPPSPTRQFSRTRNAPVNEGLARLSRELGVGLVATNDCHYPLPEDHFARDVLVRIQTGRTANAKDRMRYTAHYLKTQGEMGRLIVWSPEAVENSLQVAERCRSASTSKAAWDDRVGVAVRP